MLNLGTVASLPVSLDHKPVRESLDEKINSILDLLNQAVIDVPAVKKHLSEYTKLAMMSRVDCKTAYEKVLRQVAERLKNITSEFLPRFGSPADSPLSKQLIDSICDVIQAVQSFQSTKLAIDLLTEIIALQRLDVKISLQKGLHAQIIEDYRRLSVDTGLRESVDKRIELFNESRSLAEKLEHLSKIKGSA